MCRVFAGQDPEGYRQINRSIRIAGHSTSIQLEATFWTLLDEIADNQGLTTPNFISKLHDEAIEINGAIPNFASMLRTTCALFLRGIRPSASEFTEKEAPRSERRVPGPPLGVVDRGNRFKLVPRQDLVCETTPDGFDRQDGRIRQNSTTDG